MQLDKQITDIGPEQKSGTACRAPGSLDWPTHDMHTAARQARAEAMREMMTMFRRWLRLAVWPPIVTSARAAIWPAMRVAIRSAVAGPGEDPAVAARRRFFGVESD